MKKPLLCGILLCTLPLLSGCTAVGEKAASQSVIYGVITVLSVLLLVGCCLVVREKKGWFVLLFSSVSVVNLGYTLLSVSSDLSAALFANALAYLGSVCLPAAMLLILLTVTNTPYTRRLPLCLFLLATAMFALTASPGWSTLYYEAVSFQVVNGVSTLVKTYGPLHPLYLVYLLGYFAAMVAVILRASVKKTVPSAAHAVTLAAAVLVNIGVWLIEQLSRFDFEMLSVSYIISELFLLGVHLVVSENRRLQALVRQKDAALQTTDAAPLPALSEEEKERFLDGVASLTPTERAIYDAYCVGTPTKAILQTLHIKENTLKYHNKNLYGKLGVHSRKQLRDLYRTIHHS